MMNGPCGGSMEGKCEIGNNLDCIWEDIIRKQLKKNNHKSLIKIIHPKDWTLYKKYRWSDHHKQ
jgi:hypothetical protein